MTGVQTCLFRSIRFGRAATLVYHDEDFDFAVGRGEVLQDGNDLAIIATGTLVPEAIEAGKRLAAEGVHAKVINMATIKPLDEELVVRAAHECGRIVTVEEHNIIGGLGARSGPMRPSGSPRLPSSTSRTRGWPVTCWGGVLRRPCAEGRWPVKCSRPSSLARLITK